MKVLWTGEFLLLWLMQLLLNMESGVLAVVFVGGKADCLLLQVFIHDPLYKWALTPLGAQKRQNDELREGEGPGGVSGTEAVAVAEGSGTLANADAERTLLRVKQKLEGLEAGEAL